MNYTFFIGIDVSKNTLDFAVMKDKELLLEYRTGNDLAGIRDFWKQLQSLGGFSTSQAVFCMEHTGIYNQHLLDFLYSSKACISLEASVHIKLSGGLQRGKSDRIDAVRIAQYACKNRAELKLWQPKREIIRKLKQLSVLRSRLLNAKKQLTVPIKETALFEKNSGREMLKLCKHSIQALENDIACIEAEIDKVVASDETLKHLFSIVTSVEGIGKVTATEIIITTNEFKDITEPAKFACYSGIAPFEHSSGTSIRGKSRVSHQANKNLKTLLHMAALTAICYNTDLKTYYQRKLQENKNKMSIINAVRNKLVWRIFACVKHNKLYEKNYQIAIV